MFIDVKPPARFTTLELEVKYNEGEVRFIEEKLIDPGGGGDSVVTTCHSGKTEVDVVLVVRSQDGLLDQVLDAKLFVSPPYENSSEEMMVSLKAPLDPDKMTGTAKFNDIRPPEPHVKDLYVGIFCLFGGDEGGMRSCRLGGSVLYDNGGTDFQISSWPK